MTKKDQQSRTWDRERDRNERGCLTERDGKVKES